MADTWALPLAVIAVAEVEAYLDHAGQHDPPTTRNAQDLTPARGQHVRRLGDLDREALVAEPPSSSVTVRVTV